MKFFGLNILTDRQLEIIKNKRNFEEVLKQFKIKRLYRIYSHWEQSAKCDKCDENREYTTVLPDGQTIKTKCSCAKTKTTYGYTEVNPNDYKAVIYKFSGKRLFLSEREISSDFFNFTYEIDNLTNPTSRCLYTTKAKVQKAIKILQEREKTKAK